MKRKLFFIACLATIFCAALFSITAQGENRGEMYCDGTNLEDCKIEVVITSIEGETTIMTGEGKGLLRYIF